MQIITRSMMKLSRSLMPNRGLRVSANNFSKFVVRSPLPEINLNDAKNALPQFIMKDFLKEDRASADAIVDGSNGKTLTYKQAHDNTYSFAQSLRKFGIKKGDCIAIISPNHLQFFTAFFGVGLTGAVSSCINPLYSEYEIESQVEATNAKMIFTHPLCLEKVLKVKKNIPVMLMDDVENKPAHVLEMKTFIQESLTSFDKKAFEPAANFDSNETFTIPFSSGTTGKSKGVMLTHRNLISNVLQMYPIEGKELAATATSPRGVALNPLPYFHIYGLVVGMMIPAHAGGKQVFLPAFDLKLFLETIQKHKVTRGYIVPPIALALAKHPMVDQYDLSSVTNLMSGAAPLGFDVQALCAKRLKCTVKQGWGMTELSPVGTAMPARKWEDLEKLGATSGILVPNSEGKIVDPLTGADVDPTTEGEILIRGPHVMKGYLDNEQATNDMITKDGWLHTGDIGRFDKDGHLYLTDRMKELIKYKGFQVPPAELEALINSMPQVKDCIVIPVACPVGGEVPRAYVVKQDNCPANFKEQDVVDFITTRVAPYKKLRGGVRFTAVIPKSPSGKLLRRVQRDIDKELDSKK